MWVKVEIRRLDKRVIVEMKREKMEEMRERNGLNKVVGS